MKHILKKKSYNFSRFFGNNFSFNLQNKFLNKKKILHQNFEKPIKVNFKIPIELLILNRLHLTLNFRFVPFSNKSHLVLLSTFDYLAIAQSRTLLAFGHLRSACYRN